MMYDKGRMGKWSPKEDAELIFHARAGDNAALEELLLRYMRPVHRFVYRMVLNQHDAEDITQESLYKAWKYLGRYNQRKKFQTWVFQIAKNTTIDFLRKKKDISFSSLGHDDDIDGLEDTIPDTVLLPDELFDHKERIRQVEQVMLRCSPQIRAVLELRYGQQYTFQEIADALGESVHTVKSRHRRALIALKKALSEDN